MTGVIVGDYLQVKSNINNFLPMIRQVRVACLISNKWFQC